MLKREDREDEKKSQTHPDSETPLETDRGPMSVADALADPDGFVRGMSEKKTYCQFVAIPPMTLRTLLADFDGAVLLKLEPYTHGGKTGTLVTTGDEDASVRFGDRFGNSGNKGNDEIS